MRIVLIPGGGVGAPNSRRAVVAAFAATVVVAAACGASDGSGGGGGRPTVVASFYPLAEAAGRVGGDLVDVVNLTPPGIEPHDLELAPDDLEAIASAEVLLYLGGGFQPAIEDAVGTAEGWVVDVIQGVSTRPPPPDEADEAVTADPHVWLDPTRFTKIVDTVRAALAEADPDNAEVYAANAEAYVRELDDLDEDLGLALSSCDRRTIVVSHDAFGYLADAYGLTQVAISGLSPESEPDARRLAELKALVEREGVTTIFSEELVSPEVAETLAREAGVQTGVLNPIEGLTGEQTAAGEDYVSLMLENLDALRGALGCTR